MIGVLKGGIATTQGAVRQKTAVCSGSGDSVRATRRAMISVTLGNKSCQI